MAAFDAQGRDGRDAWLSTERKRVMRAIKVGVKSCFN